MKHSNYLGLFFALSLLLSCSSGNNKDGDDHILTVFHAGSLSVPLHEMAEVFENQNPGVSVQLEAAGSITCVRKITDLNRTCDIIALADYSLIDRMLIPAYSRWAIQFASNELCIAYNEKSKYANELSIDNWHEIISREDVRYGRSDPDSDPCGYRTLLTLKLADLYYPAGIDYDRIVAKDHRFIRPKETDLLALMETNSIDYFFIYSSVAAQHNLEYLKLPDSINLGNPGLAEFYAGVSLDIAGKEPGDILRIDGAPMVYGFTIPDNSLNPDLAIEFARFMIDQKTGLRILEEMGQKPIDGELSPGSLIDPNL